MKKIVLVLLAAGVTALSLTGCKNSSADDGKITVNFYVDYNQVNANEIYHTEKVKNGSKLKKPNDPGETNFAEFPVFLGWSKKGVIDNKEDLWDFSVDRVDVKEGVKTLNIYGIWVAEGEQ